VVVVVVVVVVRIESVLGPAIVGDAASGDNLRQRKTLTLLWFKISLLDLDHQREEGRPPPR
jgi:hypothetical protein